VIAVANETKVVEYKDSKAYQKGAEKLARDGWQVVNVTNVPRKRGFLGAMFGLGRRAGGKKGQRALMVTYAR
jgi:hypothetical protein